MTPTKDFKTRFDTAKQFRKTAEPYLTDVLRYCAPGREHDFTASNTRVPAEHETDVFISIGEELAGDLAGDLVTYFTPSEVKWAEYQVMVPVPEDQVDAVMDLVEAREEQLADIITASNFYDMAPQWAFEAASHGTAAIWVDKAHLSQPIFFEAIPPHQIYLVPGHLGYLDRFRETRVLAETLPALFDGWDVSLTDEMLKKKMAKVGEMVTCVWGFWLDWKDPGNPQWRCEITVDGKRITPDAPLTLGPLAGTCPLLVGRFNPQIAKPWGRGPGWKALPDLRVLDTLDETVMAGLDQSLMSTIIYPDDGHLDLSEGIEAGRAYPASARFDRNSIFELTKSVNVDQGWFTEERIEDRLRRAFFQDGPRQRGDTPPTAAQWLDERRRVQQRLGKPSAPLWSELIYPMIQRIEYLAVKTGLMENAITLDGQTINVMPISPLQKAQNQDKVQVARSNLELAFSILQDQAGTVIDMVGTMKNIVKTSGDELTVIREEQTQPQPTTGTPANVATAPAA